MIPHGKECRSGKGRSVKSDHIIWVYSERETPPEGVVDESHIEVGRNDVAKTMD